jgi:hypothetical protein
MTLTERLKLISYQMVQDSEGVVTPKNHAKMLKFVKELQKEWTSQGI